MLRLLIFTQHRFRVLDSWMLYMRSVAGRATEKYVNIIEIQGMNNVIKMTRGKLLGVYCLFEKFYTPYISVLELKSRLMNSNIYFRWFEILLLRQYTAQRHNKWFLIWV